MSESAYIPDPMPDSYETGTIQTGCGGAMVIEEVDGGPSVSGLSTLIVPNGTLTDNGSGSATLTITGSGADGTLFGAGSPEGSQSGSRGDTYYDTTNDTFWVKKSGDTTTTGWIQVV